MKIAIVGSRSITDANVVYTTLVEELKSIDPKTLTIVSGGAKGIDTVAKEVASSLGIDFIEFKPYFVLDKQAEYSPRHFFIRNEQIIDNVDKVFVFWDGKSNGTRHAIKCAQNKGKEVVLISPQQEEVKHAQSS